MDKLRKIIEVLLEQSEKGLVDWQSTASVKNFQVSFKDSTIRISFDDSFNQDDYYVYVLNGSGEIVENASHREMDSVYNGPSNLTSFEILGRLYQLARRKAYRTDETLDGILQELSAR